MMGGEQTARHVLDLVEAWSPEKAYGHESKFQNDLKAFLDEQLNEQGGGTGLLGGLGGGQEHVVSRERGKARADVVVDDLVGIELKRDLTNSQTKKLRGQIEEYCDEYPFVIVCACGIEDMDGWRSLKNKYEGTVGGLGMDASEVRFVHKRKENYGKDHDFGGGGLLDGWL